MASLINNITLNTNVNEKKPVQTENKSYLLNEPIKDTVEIKNKSDDKDKKLSTATKAGIAASIGVLSAIGFALYKARFTEIKKLAENIEFQPAKTLQEAIDFTKTKLGINNVIGFEEKDLAVLNWANQGFVNVSNAHNGNLRMPKYLVYEDKLLGENTMAGVLNCPGNMFHGYFGINKNYFKNIDKTIEEAIKTLEDTKIFNLKNDGSCEFMPEYIPEVSVKYMKAFFTQAKSKTLSFDEKIALDNIYQNICSQFVNKRKNIYKQILENKEYVQLLKENGINPQKLLIPTSAETEKTYGEIIDKLIADNKIKIPPSAEQKNGTKKVSVFRTIYHELGHIQDMVKRTSAISNFDYDEKKYPKELLEWLNNKENIDCARLVSEYASHGPGEFIAEAYAEMITGNKLPDEVIKLYKKLNGPSIPNIV